MSKQLKVNVGGRKQVDLGSSSFHYVGAGGQASIYQGGGVAYKLFHDAKGMIPVGKMQELMGITAPNVVKPLDVLYATNGDAAGYTMKYLAGMQPVCKLFTKGFKQDNAVTPDMIVELVRQLQLSVASIHRDGCLVVDLNELNVLVADDLVSPFLIDTDSFQTKSYRATAIMDSVRDRVAAPGHFSPLTDWFSFAVMAVQLYLNIHPFKGSHPKYLPSDMNKRMDDNVSIFHPGVKLPVVCNPLSVIPPRHLEWLKAVLLHKERSIPPMADAGGSIQVPANIVLVNGTDKFEVKELFALDSDILFWMEHFGVDYLVTRTGVYKGQDLVWKRASAFRKVLTCVSDAGELVIAGQAGKQLTFMDKDGVAFGQVLSDGCFYRNNCFYTVNRGRMFETRFTSMSGKVLPMTKAVAQVSEFNTHLYPGVVVQDLLGRVWLTIPYSQGFCASHPVPALDGYRIIDAKSERGVCIVVAERKGKYSRFILEFKADFSGFDLREEVDIAYDGINFTVLENGLTILLAGDELQLARKGTIHQLSNPPLSANMRLFSKAGNVFFLNGSSVYSLKMLRP